jgi:methylaspartate mutase sigma subunit
MDFHSSHGELSHSPGAVFEAPARPGLTVLLTGVASDSHTWNLVFLELLFTELGHRVVNLGPCVPPELLVRTGQQVNPDLIVMSSVNGHGLRDGVRAVEAVRRCPELSGTAAVIGGKLGIAGVSDRAHIRQLLDAGFDAVFEDGDGVQPLDEFLAGLTERLIPNCVGAS